MDMRSNVWATRFQEVIHKGQIGYNPIREDEAAHCVSTADFADSSAASAAGDAKVFLIGSDSE